MPNNQRRSATEAGRSAPQGSTVRSEPKIVRQLTAVDRRIVEVLRRNARTPNNAVAAEVGLAPSTCLGRIRALEERGIIRGYHADVDREAFGTPVQAMIAVRLRAGARAKLRRFTGDLTSRPEVISVYFLAGVNDFMVHVAVADTPALRDFVVEALSANPEVAVTETNLIFEHARGSAS